jgi:hypothetical protein
MDKKPRKPRATTGRPWKVVVGARVRPEVRDALERAADAEVRTVGNALEMAAIEWLRARGWLVPDAEGKATEGAGMAA